MALHIVNQIYAAVPTMSEYSVISHLDLINLGILHIMSCITETYESDMYHVIVNYPAHVKASAFGSNIQIKRLRLC